MQFRCGSLKVCSHALVRNIAFLTIHNVLNHIIVINFHTPFLPTFSILPSLFYLHKSIFSSCISISFWICSLFCFDYKHPYTSKTATRLQWKELSLWIPSLLERHSLGANKQRASLKRSCFFGQRRHSGCLDQGTPHMHRPWLVGVWLMH